jgi:hypothetical protein
MGRSYRILVENSEGKRPLGRPRCRLVDHVKMYLRDVGWGGMDWIDVVQDYCQVAVVLWNCFRNSDAVRLLGSSIFLLALLITSPAPPSQTLLLSIILTHVAAFQHNILPAY